VRVKPDLFNGDLLKVPLGLAFGLTAGLLLFFGDLSPPLGVLRPSPGIALLGDFEASLFSSSVYISRLNLLIPGFI
jgi:hypothetical protein